ncbi:hypothetical protein JRQ81_016485 [Phrynocephalus forsythii]|uniref:Uncharacterized protein n=1 Tax=Phrynocephalus forsythii TaxID=171643 RepID=A0A9Q0XSB0_9SAUR|nr:hypothetical protein JRQ81_016485 [Phrynocephalus forsythii]
MKEMRQMKSELAGLMSLGLKDVMRKMDELSRKVDNTNQDLSREIKQTQAAVDSNGQKLENMAGEIKSLDIRVTKNESEINSQKQELLTAKKKLTYMEDYSRRQNTE